jgi:uncharacterized membrane protein YcaP (DUF421 family)
VSTILRAILAYAFLIVTVRAMARRPGGQLTPFEFVLIFFIGGLGIQAVVADDRSLTNAFVAIGTIGMTHALLTCLKQKFPSFGRIVDGTPVVIRENNDYHWGRMAHHGLQEEDILAAAREQGLSNERQIRYAVLERNGHITIVAND